MVKVLLYALFILAGAQVVTAASFDQVQKCPTIEITAKEAAVNPGGTVALTVKVTNPEPNIDYTYNWSLTSGALTSGQGTSQVTIELESERTTVTVSLGGGSPSCLNTTSITITPKGQGGSEAGSEALTCGLLRSFDAWSELPAVDEIIRLDNIALEAQRESTLNLVIVIYGGKHTYPNEVGGHIARITDYLNRLRGVSSDNLLIINGGYRDTAWLECWFLPKNLEPPQPAPEVAGRDLVYDRKPPDMSEWDRTLSQLKQGK